VQFDSDELIKKTIAALSNAKVRHGVVDSYQHLMSIMGK